MFFSLLIFTVSIKLDCFNFSYEIIELICTICMIITSFKSNALVSDACILSMNLKTL